MGRSCCPKLAARLMLAATSWTSDTTSGATAIRRGGKAGNTMAGWLVSQPLRTRTQADFATHGGGDRNAIPLYKFPSAKVTTISFRRCRYVSPRCAHLALT